MKAVMPGQIRNFPKDGEARRSLLIELRKADYRLNRLSWIHSLGAGLIAGISIICGRIISESHGLAKIPTQLGIAAILAGIWIPLMLYFFIYPRVNQLLNQNEDGA